MEGEGERDGSTCKGYEIIVEEGRHCRERKRVREENLQEEDRYENESWERESEGGKGRDERPMMQIRLAYWLNEHARASYV